jgi:hypothetical protein
MPTGRLTNIGQHDWIAVSLTANQAYEFTIVSASAEIATADALSGNGTAAFSIAASSVGLSPAGTQYMYFMPSVSGTYYIDVSDSFGSVPDNYTVSVAAVTADFTDNPTHPGVITIGRPALVVSDFNNDGLSDFLFQNSSGEGFIWELSGTSLLAPGSIGNPGPAWRVRATGDFNDDGFADILWQNADGSVAIWEMNGANLIGGGIVANPGPSWHSIGTGDFDGDGHADLLWQNSGGSVAVWEMNGTSLVASAGHRQSRAGLARHWHG